MAVLPDITSVDQIIEGLRILNKYDRNSISAEHDVLYAGPGEEIVEGTEDDEDPVGTVVSKEDATRLKELGWHLDSEVDSWAHFV